MANSISIGENGILRFLLGLVFLFHLGYQQILWEFTDTILIMRLRWYVSAVTIIPLYILMRYLYCFFLLTFLRHFRFCFLIAFLLLWLEVLWLVTQWPEEWKFQLGSGDSLRFLLNNLFRRSITIWLFMEASFYGRILPLYHVS